MGTLPNVPGAPGYLTGACEETGSKGFGRAITSLKLMSGEQTLWVGVEGGGGFVCRHDRSYLRKRLEKQLQSLGFF
ncbi:hypothetical protein TrVE_jg13415 [Triparma verrucosa]|uniref:Uncharacterized protein n=2 Tax=Triparma TaxID=722752 RepID=A0A9W7DWE0_9STRA|nr:hypothetical protein TrST_g3953 [Triparma strigata]GMH96913.1 hypothetical protein TrVE_jg13415 [Triparma verrucosa]